MAFRVFYLSSHVGEVENLFRVCFDSETEAINTISFLEGKQRVKRLVYTTTMNAEEAVRKGDVDLVFHQKSKEGIVLPPRRAFPSADWDIAVDLEVIYNEQSALSQEALAYVQRCCAAENLEFLRVRLLWCGVQQQRAEPVRLIPKAAEGGRLSLAVFVPLALILMTITGAVYPAIDLTAGERERGTLEVLVAAPIPRVGLLFAKYLAVATVAVLTGLVNVTAMSLSLIISGQTERVCGSSGPSVLILIEIFGLIVLFAGFFSAVLLVVTSFARSFKEAQAYLVPLMLVSLVPGMLGLVPGLFLSKTLALVPLLNIVLLSRDLLEGKAIPQTAVLVVSATALYAFLAVAAAARLFGAEAVLYTESGSWRRLFRRHV
jgi:ABC-2 type transport system permease protein/sodium transport system permease protein